MLERHQQPLLSMGVLLLVINLGLRPLAEFLPEMLYYVLKSVFLALVFYLGFHRRLGLKLSFRPRTSFWEQLSVSWLLVVYLLFIVLPLLVIGLSHYPQAIWDALVSALVAGFLEEYICRGLFLQMAFQAGNRSYRQVMWAVFLSSLFFGLAHLSNSLIQPMSHTLFQVYYAFALGVYFCALVIRTGSLWWVIVPHFLMDFSVILAANGSKASGGPTLLGIMVWFLILLIGLYLLREKKLEALIKEFLS
ncbi:CPBP family intramembrane glutamic endopeptidase [Streptococcus sp. DD12]|uniref:CPBP family intramembrane glutamic endopeptidase n=1 Tax=Streptococcus sp. DD12 TaxID=1777880 RepID=UPI00079A30F5|nr:CPBP family intramembrane glutamic endopeptidase [Streptococcus sp. DD12]KXT76196.1 hypothetical protein STRDD12_00692 [Streptococcus sp. DD12]